MSARWEATSTLALDARGVLDGASFTLVGRTCVRGGRGAIWNEWSLRFDDGRARFLSESATGLAIYEEGSLFPAIAELTPGSELDPGWLVVARGAATRVARWGTADDAPDAYTYADFSSRGGHRRATLDRSAAGERLFVGRVVSLPELGLVPRSGLPALVAVPEVSRPAGVELWLDCGDEGALGGEGDRAVVVGIVARSIEGRRWEEYLVAMPRGLRWLSVAEGHWSLAAAVEVGAVDANAATATFDGVAHALTGRGVARVDWAAGELPWEVMIGETSSVLEFVDGESSLTREATADEVSWSHATSIDAADVAKAFGKRALPKPR